MPVETSTSDKDMPVGPTSTGRSGFEGAIRSGANGRHVLRECDVMTVRGSIEPFSDPRERAERLTFVFS